MKKIILNGSEPQNVATLMQNPAAAMPTQTLAKHNIMPAKTTIPEAQPLQQPNTQQKSVAPKPTKRIYETGIIPNIAHMQQLTLQLATFTPAYLPINPLITIDSLNQAIADAYLFVDTVETKKVTSKNSINTRFSNFNGLPKYITRIINELEACGAAPKTVKDARYYVDKIRGARAIKLSPDDPKKAISVAQTSYNNQAQHFKGLVEVVAQDPMYDSNTPDLKLTALTAHSSLLMGDNKTVQKGNAILTTSRIDRNHFFNDVGTGFIDRGLAAKKAVKAMFGATSPEYRSISSLRFSRIK